MRFLFVQSFYAEFDDEETAQTLAIGMEKASQLQMASIAEQLGLSDEDTAIARGQYVGVQILKLPDEVLA